MELRDLEYFVAICDEKSFTNAAMVCHVTQPTLTVAINRLEESFGVQLLNRGKKKKHVTRTLAGELLYTRARELLAMVDSTREELYATIDNQIHFGLPQILGAYFFPKILSRFMKKNPDVDIEIHEMDNDKIIEKVAKGEIALGLITRFNERKNENLVYRKIGSEPVRLCTSLEHPFSKRTEVSIAELQKEKFILFAKNSSHYLLSEHLFAAGKITPNVFLTSDKIQTIKYMVASNIGVGLLIEMALLASKSELAIIPLKEPAQLDIYLCYHRHRPLQPKAETMLKFISSYTGAEESEFIS